MSDDDYQAAKDTLDGHIRDFFTRTTDGKDLVTAWILVAHRVSAELDEDGSSVVSRTTPTGQRFHVSRGLLDVALTSDRNTQ